MAAFFLVAGLFAPICAAFSDRWGGRVVLLAIATLYSLGMLLMAVVHSQWHFFLVYSVLLSLVFTMSLGPMVSLVIPWFSRQLGLGVGILWLAGALGATGLLPALAYLLETVGWRPAFFTFGLVGGCVMFPLAFWYGGMSKTRRPPIIEGNAAWIEQQVVKARRWLVSTQVRNTRAYWNLPITHGLGCGGHGIVQVYLIDLLVHEGFTSVEAALIMAISQAFALPSRLLAPLVAQRTDARIVMSAVLALQGLSALALLFTDHLTALCMVAAVFGLAYGSESSVYPVVNRRYFGDGISSGVYGRQVLGGLVGQSLAVVIGRAAHQPSGQCGGFRPGDCVELRGRRPGVGHGKQQVRAGLGRRPYAGLRRPRLASAPLLEGLVVHVDRVALGGAREGLPVPMTEPAHLVDDALPSAPGACQLAQLLRMDDVPITKHSLFPFRRQRELSLIHIAIDGINIVYCRSV